MKIRNGKSPLSLKGTNSILCQHGKVKRIKKGRKKSGIRWRDIMTTGHKKHKKHELPIPTRFFSLHKILSLLLLSFLYSPMLHFASLLDILFYFPVFLLIGFLAQNEDSKGKNQWGFPLGWSILWRPDLGGHPILIWRSDVRTSDSDLI